MNGFFIGMLITLVAYVAVSALVSRRVKDANDF